MKMLSWRPKSPSLQHQHYILFWPEQVYTFVHWCKQTRSRFYLPKEVERWHLDPSSGRFALPVRCWIMICHHRARNASCMLGHFKMQDLPIRTTALCSYHRPQPPCYRSSTFIAWMRSRIPDYSDLEPSLWPTISLLSGAREVRIMHQMPSPEAQNLIPCQQKFLKKLIPTTARKYL